MLSAICGDIIGSVFEFDNYRAKDFDLFNVNSTFTDDTVLTVAIAEAYYRAIPSHIKTRCLDILDARTKTICHSFTTKFVN